MRRDWPLPSAIRAVCANERLYGSVRGWRVIPIPTATLPVQVVTRFENFDHKFEVFPKDFEMYKSAECATNSRSESGNERT